MTAADLADTLVADVIAAYPAAARVFIDHRMSCVGCAFAAFETVSEAARAYGVDPSELVNSLAAACGLAGATTGDVQ